MSGNNEQHGRVVLITGASSGIGAAVAASTASIPATIFNAVFMAVAVSLLYVPVKQIYQKIMYLNDKLP